MMLLRSLKATKHLQRKSTFRTLIIAATLVLVIPLTAPAQTLGDEGSFTLHAFTIGLIMVGVIFLVFLGLMLMARVNELSSWWKSPALKTRINNPVEDIMNLDEDEIEHLLSERSGANHAAGELSKDPVM